MMNDMSLAFAKIAELHKTMKLPPLGEMPTPWECAIDDNWYMAVSGMNKEFEVAPPDGMAASVPAFHAMVWWHGWPAAVFHPYGGEFMDGDAANEDAFIAALDVRIVQEADKATGRTGHTLRTVTG